METVSKSDYGNTYITDETADIESISRELNRQSRRYAKPFQEEGEIKIK